MAPDAPVLIGHPFAPMGIGEHIRSSFFALKAAGAAPLLRDIYGWEPKDPDLASALDRSVVGKLGRGVNIYHINADEVTQAFRHMATEMPRQAYNIIYPLWELSRYPAEWLAYLELFDEVWAQTEFIADALRGAVKRPVTHLPGACDARFSAFLGRRHFGIPESSFVFLFVFDLTSHVERKNPAALLDAYARYAARRPQDDSCLVVKIGGMHRHPEKLEEFRELCARRQGRTLLIDRVLSDNEIKNLVRNSDCLVSLHRSEGFGRVLLEAMFWGKPVVGTAYSGNVDFMNAENSCLVDYTLVPVGNRYPHGEGQVWAEPDIDHAAHWMERLAGSPALCRRIGANASSHIRSHFSPRAVGLRYAARLAEIGRG
jgi:glycosyltransferase involved in cell wall biosynthesis